MIPTELAKTLAALPLFAKTDPVVLSTWLEKHRLPVLNLENGARIDHMNARELGILLSGRAQIQSADNGRSVILRELSAPGIFGAAALFCDGDIPMSRIEAKSDTAVLYIPLEAVNALLDTDTGFRNAYLTFLSNRVRFLNRKILCFTAGSAERRLALWLVSEENEKILLPASLTALADMLDIGRASLYRAFDKLESERLIRRHGREILVVSQEEILKKYQ
ncbi:MAG: Crp/Fnr family transcriptional regulator [Ruminococcaceae bacterium]|nr:Crp/Fnr family transcriptional regulator [Oscillospiraceae bacterium]